MCPDYCGGLLSFIIQCLPMKYSTLRIFIVMFERVVKNEINDAYTHKTLNRVIHLFVVLM